MEQLGLMFRQVRTRRDPRADERLLIEQLRDKTGWVASSTLEAALQWDDRKVRRVASASDFVIGRIGTIGYKYIRNATPDEIEHFKNARLSSAKAQIRDALRKVRVWHSGKVFEG
ncbi:MAG: hypothetical protein KF715_08410 [Candidatus Didemnitutus sp.]|nr:hypothetical protein [Candidatus Didemnitutus sp.]